ncbi:MAG: AI-2E family transporter [Spirochaetales bacterium]|nr:AI-2E family transporter [Spirochaetales bacterium]
MKKNRATGIHALSDRRPIDPTIWVFLGYFVIFILLFKLSPSILGALVLGWYLSMIIEVPARALSKIKFISYKVAVIISSILIFAVLVSGISLLIPLLIDEGKRFFDLLIKGMKDLDIGKMLNIENEAVLGQIVETTDTFLANISQQAARLGGSALNWVVPRVPDATTAVLIFVIAASYFTAAVPILKRNLWRFFPRSGRSKAISFASVFYGDLRHFIGGQVIIALFVGVIMGVGMLIAGIPYALFLGFLAGITNFIPFLGVVIAGIPALLVGLTHDGVWGMVKVLIVILLTNQIESWVLSPRIQGKRMRLNWFIIIIAIFFCAQFLGIIGVLLAIPMLIFFRDFWTGYVQTSFEQL